MISVVFLEYFDTRQFLLPVVLSESFIAIMLISKGITLSYVNNKDHFSRYVNILYISKINLIL